jgi:hypothetical protein
MCTRDVASKAVDGTHAPKGCRGGLPAGACLRLACPVPTATPAPTSHGDGHGGSYGVHVGEVYQRIGGSDIGSRLLSAYFR